MNLLPKLADFEQKSKFLNTSNTKPGNIGPAFPHGQLREAELWLPPGEPVLPALPTTGGQFFIIQSALLVFPQNEGTSKAFLAAMQLQRE